MVEEGDISFKVGEDERIDYGRSISLTSEHQQATARIDAAYEVLVVERGQGSVAYQDVVQNLSTGDRIIIPGGEEYTLRLGSTPELSIVIFGVSKNF